MSRSLAPLARLTLVSLEPAIAEDDLGKRATVTFEDPLGTQVVTVLLPEE